MDKNKCAKCNYANMVSNKYGMIFTTDNCDLFEDNLCPNYTNPARCEYSFEISNIGICCGAYGESKRPDGRHWAHYPFCEENDCPLIHPDLLEGAEL